MSEAKSLVAWLKWPNMQNWQRQAIADQLHGNYEHATSHEYAHDLSGRFLGVFREVRA